jgi:hypothetical protein
MFSASIRPLTAKTTSPFAVLVILSIFPLSQIPRKTVVSSCDGNYSSNPKVLRMHELAVSEMSKNPAIVEGSSNTRDWMWSRLLRCGFFSQKANG